MAKEICNLCGSELILEKKEKKGSFTPRGKETIAIERTYNCPKCQSARITYKGE